MYLPLLEATVNTELVESITGSMAQVKTDGLAVLSGVAPYAIAIFGAYLVWMLGKKFFKGIAK